MTVAAVILAASVESALADADGQPRVRRIADAAWAGGALPVIVVAPDSDGAVGRALAGAEVTLAEPAPIANGPAGQMGRGMAVAAAEVTGMDAALLWPARFAWVGPETVTSLIEAHGLDRSSLLRPGFHGEAGWPVLLPHALADRLAMVAPERMPEEVLADLAATGIAIHVVDLGDPGATLDGGTPRADLPPYEGPLEPGPGQVHEWGASIADWSEDAPLAGPAVAPYQRAATEG